VEKKCFYIFLSSSPERKASKENSWKIHQNQLPKAEWVASCWFIRRPGARVEENFQVQLKAEVVKKFTQVDGLGSGEADTQLNHRLSFSIPFSFLFASLSEKGIYFPAFSDKRQKGKTKNFSRPRNEHHFSFSSARTLAQRRKGFLRGKRRCHSNIVGGVLVGACVCHACCRTNLF
jgi:hypothetical protein